MKAQDQIQSRLNNYRETLTGLVTSSQAKNSPPAFTEWHKKQIAVMEAKIAELEWVLSGSCETAEKIKSMKS